MTNFKFPEVNFKFRSEWNVTP